MYIYMYTYVCVYIYTRYIYNIYTHTYMCGYIFMYASIQDWHPMQTFHNISLHRGVLKLSTSWFHVVDSDRRRGLEILLTCWSCLKMSEKTQYLIVRNRFSWFFPYETAMVEGFSGRCFHRPEVTIKTVLKGPKTGLTSDWLNITSQPHI